MFFFIDSKSILVLFFKLYHYQFKTDDILLNSEVLNSFFAINSKNLISFLIKNLKKS